MGMESGLRRRVQGLSEADFRARFGSEEACRAMLFELRWGQGWSCPACGHGRCAELKTRALYQCNSCKHQVGLTAGPIILPGMLRREVFHVSTYGSSVDPFRYCRDFAVG